MTTSAHANVHNIALEGSFDDAQSIVKSVVRRCRVRRRDQPDGGELDQLRPHRGAVRLLLHRHGGAGASATFVVPTGNFGDIFAGEAAQRMGLDVARLVIATNANDIMARALNDGVYASGASHATFSRPWTSRWRRISSARLFEASGRDADWTAAAMSDFARSRKLELPRDRAGTSCAPATAPLPSNDDETRAAIAAVHKQTGPHHRSAHRGRRRRQSQDWASRRSPVVVLSTAHPAKFPDAGAQATGAPPPVPPAPGGPEEPAGKAGNSAGGACFDKGNSSLLDWRDDPGNIQTFQWLDRRDRPMPGIESAALGIWVNTGSRNEMPRPDGRFPHARAYGVQGHGDARSARAIAEEIEAVGGVLNAYTSREQTAFHARVLKEDVAAGAGHDRRHSHQPGASTETELERERQVVLQELGQARDTPDDIVFDHLQAAIFPGQPLGWSDPGRRETVTAFDRGMLRNLHGVAISRRRHDPDRVGRGQSRCDREAGGRQMRRPQSGRRCPPAAVALCRRRFPRGSKIWNRRMSPLPFPASPTPMPDYFVGQLYATALGGGTSSRLFQEAREKRGLCYSIYAFSNGFQDSGFLGVYAGTGEAEAGEMSAVIAGEMEAIAGNLTEAEVSRARAQLKVSLLMGLERAGARAEQIAGQLFALGRVQSPAEIVAQLDAIDAAAVKRFAARVMQARRSRPSPRWARSADWKAIRLSRAGSAPMQLPARGRIMVKAAFAQSQSDRLHARPDFSGRPAAGDPRRTGFICAIRAWPIISTGRSCATQAASSSRPGNRSGPMTN